LDTAQKKEVGKPCCILSYEFHRTNCALVTRCVKTW